MSDQTASPQEDRPDEISVLRKQLAISLKFHHSETLARLPKELAIQTLMEVWNSCHPEIATKRSASAVIEDVPVTKGSTIYL